MWCFNCQHATGPRPGTSSSTPSGSSCGLIGSSPLTPVLIFLFVWGGWKRYEPGERLMLPASKCSAKPCNPGRTPQRQMIKFNVFHSWATTSEIRKACPPPPPPHTRLHTKYDPAQENIVGGRDASARVCVTVGILMPMSCFQKNSLLCELK